MSLLSFGGAQWWDSVMLLVVALGLLLAMAWSLISWLSHERINFLYSVKWHGRFNTYDVYGICVEIRSRHHLHLVTRKQDMIAVYVLDVLRDNSTWEELPFWMHAQIQNYIVKNSIPTKTSLEIAYCITTGRSSNAIPYLNRLHDTH